MTTEEMIAWIDQASYEDLLRKWRFAPIGDPFFLDQQVQLHYVESMGSKGKSVDTAAASKRVGWKK